MGTQPKVLIYDIEIAPIIGTLWQKWETNMVWMIQDWYMLCFAYKWGDEKKVTVISQDDFKGYKKGSPDDRKVLKELHALFNQADIIVAHNGDKFDQKKSNARFIINGMEPVSGYQAVDTLKVAKKYFGFTSNKLDDLGEYLGLGRKIRTDKELWQDCMAGDPKAWQKMKAYNKQDVVLLEKVYHKMLPWDTGHPNMANIAGRPDACPKCLAEGFLWAQGVRYTKTGQYRRFQCKNCGSYISMRNQEKAVQRPNYV